MIILTSAEIVKSPGSHQMRYTSNVMPFYRTLLLTALLSLFGAGCFFVGETPKVAESLATRTPESVVTQQNGTQQNGFGSLPKIPQQKNHVSITLKAAIPRIPPKITVIRLRHGTPNNVELRNIAAAIGIPIGTIGAHPSHSNLYLSWTDNFGYQWTYRADERALDFTLLTTTTPPLTVSVLPSNNELLHIANNFLLSARAIDPQSYRSALVDPDWNNWWLRAKAAGLCMDVSTIKTVRAIGFSDPLIAGGPPPLPSSASTTCVAPEFPSKAVIRYRTFVDQRDVIGADGTYINGISLAINVITKTVTGGHISLYPNPDRSDYPGLSAADAVALLKTGGVTPVTGNITITAVNFASYKLDTTSEGIRTTYLIPALVGTGIETTKEGTIRNVRIVAPLLKP